MRRHIKLTGRKQLPASSFDVNLLEDEDRQFASLSILKPEALKGFPGDARIRLRFVENKLVSVLDFGTIANPQVSVPLKDNIFTSPSCQLRVVNTAEQKMGLLLGSTKSWTVGNASGAEGILRYDTTDLGHLIWKLDIRDDEYPVLYVNEKIPNARNWVSTDPTFIGSVLPAVIQLVFLDILEQDAKPEIDWMVSWLDWAETLMPGAKPPYGDELAERKKWIQQLTESFAQKFHLVDRLVKQLGDPE